MRGNFAEGTNGLKKTPIILNNRDLGVIKVAPTSCTELLGTEADRYLDCLSSLLAAKVEAAQAEEEARYLTAILETFEEGTLVINDAGTVDYGNSAAAGLLGLKRRDLAALLLEKYWPALASFKSLLNGRESASCEIPYCRKDRRVNLLVTAHRVKAGRGSSRVFFIKDPEKRLPMSGQSSGGRHRFTFADIIGRSKIIEQVKERAVRVAAGTRRCSLRVKRHRKDVFAQAIHYGSPRFRPFVSVNCGYPKTFESELLVAKRVPSPVH